MVNFSLSSRGGKMEPVSKFNNMILKIATTSKLHPKSEHVSARKTKRVACELHYKIVNLGKLILVKRLFPKILIR